MKLYQKIAQTFDALRRCEARGNQEGLDKHKQTILDLVENHMPSGSGFDNGTTFDFDCVPNRLVFHTSFHHMDESGCYDGWTEHSVTVTPDFVTGFDLKISGRDRNDIKDYIGEVFSYALNEEVE